MNHLAHVASVVLFVLVGLSLSPGRSTATPVTEAFVATDTDWTWAAVGGIGGGNRHGGRATLVLNGVTGSVKEALLYWHGIDNFTPRNGIARPAGASGAGGGQADAALGPMHSASCDGFYNVPTIFFDGHSVTGEPLGDSETNCWGDGSSRAFRADVTAFVAGNGLYTLNNMTADECDDANGASLVVLFTDGNPANNHDLVFAEGNDTNLAFFSRGDTDGWHASIEGIHYTTGPATIQLHVADGQEFAASGLDDSTLTISAGGPAVEIPDSFNRYDGESTPNAGFSRAEVSGARGSLWDVHTFDITPVFTAPGEYTLTLDGQERVGGDCTGLVLAIVELRAATLVATHAARWGDVKAMYR